eukprot:CAMPEP_0197592296 /NCGR_PEP_ID=MMETSP1326-20131121/15017_1 /TAXON_ID=1155430 /ORGANISM="Genus nov. species nov., Strain RCC2288" /LENGTH=145 /DNA_ID=CAMNT_0043157981 /DNA_START=18 /DNA_END=455 /DNA_ORIENTATION=+
MSAFAMSASIRAPVAVNASSKASTFSRGSARVSQVRVAARPVRTSARLSTVRTSAKQAGLGRDGKSVTGRKPNPAFAQVDGKLWVCQGCGYLYDGSLGKWAEEKRCPACGERRFALKTEGEMNLAFGSILVVLGLSLLLFAITQI